MTSTPALSRDAFPTDRNFPGLELAADLSAMREIFRARLRPLAVGIGEIWDCALVRVRYRPGDRCLLQYSVRLVDPATGRERSQWVTGALFTDGRAERAFRQLRAGGPERRIPEALRTFEPVDYVPEADMLIQVFPYDRRLPTLPMVMAGPTPDLERLLLTRADIGRRVTWEVEPVRYRPRLGAVVRYRVRGDGPGRREPSFYVKVYPDERGQQTFELQHRLHGRDRKDGGLEVDAPIAYLGDLQALVLNEAPGISLEQIVLEGRDAVAAARRVAGALAAFHTEPLITARRCVLTEYIADLVRIGTLLGWACPVQKLKVERIMRRVASGLEECPPAPTHRDLKPAHLLLEGDRLRIIDLDDLAGADPLEDVADLTVRLATLREPMWGPRDHMQGVAWTLADAYLAQVPRGWRGRLRYHYAAALLNAAAGFFRTQQPRWRERAAELIDAAVDALTRRALPLTR